VLDEGSEVEFQIIAGELCLDFINTLDNRPAPDRQMELLPTYQDLADWAVAAGASGAVRRTERLRQAAVHPQAAQAALHKAIDLRECLYRIVSATVRKGQPSSDDLTLFSRFLGEALSNLQLKSRRSGFRLDWNDEPARLDSILWPIVRSASDLLTSRDREYIRECDSASCRWLFIDRSKNHRRRWCDMKVCGNRMKARKFYRKQSGRSHSSQPSR
jgi:predicted RNA-binding Zn ribbon-like protein